MLTNGYYQDILYPLQDRALQIIHQLDTQFYLSGGTAASRGYLNHRFSDDLDLFVDDDDRFGLWADRLIQAFVRLPDWRCEVNLREERFVRLNVVHTSHVCKIELINDVPAHIGVVRDHPLLGRLDSPENILANKITAALDREAPKDLADIWGFCCQVGLSLEQAITDASSKAAGIFPADLARVLCSVMVEDWQAVRWIAPPPVELYLAQLISLGENLLLAGFAPSGG